MKKTVKAWAVIICGDLIEINLRKIHLVEKYKFGEDILPISITYKIPKRKGNK